MTVVVPAEHFAVERWPCSVIRRDSTIALDKRMAGGANADDWFPFGNEFANDVHLRFWWRAPPDAEERDVRVVEHLDARQFVTFAIRPGDEGDFEVAAKIFASKLWQRAIGGIFLVGNDHHQMFALVTRKSKRLAADKSDRC